LIPAAVPAVVYKAIVGLKRGPPPLRATAPSGPPDALARPWFRSTSVVPVA